MSQEVRINGGYNLLINGVYWGYNPLILTFDPNFQRDIQGSLNLNLLICQWEVGTISNL